MGLCIKLQQNKAGQSARVARSVALEANQALYNHPFNGWKIKKALAYAGGLDGWSRPREKQIVGKRTKAG